MTWLLDGNVLVALQIDTHVHHGRAHRWFAGLRTDSFATCCMTQGTLLRVHMMTAVDRSPAAAWRALEGLVAHPKHRWWREVIGFMDVPHRSLQGAHQVTDAWLAEISRRHQGRLATLDSALAALHGDVAVLIPAWDICAVAMSGLATGGWIRTLSA